MFARANGYEHDEVDIRVVQNEIVQTPIRKFYPPDTTAAIFWLKNRRPDMWRDKTDVAIAGADGKDLFAPLVAASEALRESIRGK